MKHLISEEHNLVLIGWFVAFILHQELNAPLYVKRLLRLRISKYYKVIDCYPCVTIWTTLALTWSPLASIGAYLIAVIIDKLNK